MKHRRISRIALWIGMPLVLLTGIGTGGFFYGKAKFNPDPPKLDYPAPESALDAQRQDIDYYRKLIALDRSFSPALRAEAERRLSALAASKMLLDRAHFRVALLSITALADNGHTSLFSKKPIRPVQLPIRVAEFSDGLYVMRVKPENIDLLGARIVMVDGHPVEEVLTKLETLRGGTTAWRRNYALLVLVSSEFLYGAGIAPSPDRSTWTFVTPDGRTVERRFKGYQPAYEEPQPDLWRWMSPEPIKGDKDKWAAFAPEGLRLPVAFQDADQTFRRVRLPGTCIMLIQMKANEGDGISDFLEATEADLKASPPCEIIFDNRYNGGGDYTNTAGFAGRLHALVQPGGHIYLLTGPQTFSAGITTTVFIKQAAAPSQVVILGEPVGDRLRFYSEGNFGCLPHAPFCVHYATGMHDYTRTPCRDVDKCYWLNWIYPAHTDSLKPAETVIMTFADYLAGRDPVFDRALELATKHGAQGS
ncbi:MAG TPA: hypothetical protein VL286_04080 [Rhizomicrobium sp.]|nr:hypothetical protein [Rhizomicrobium sp.]